MMLATQEFLFTAAIVVAWAVIGSGIAQTAVYFAQLIVAAYALVKRPPVARSSLLWRRYGDVAPPIALIIPAYNEEKNIVESVHSMLSLEYPDFEVIVVNDGSKDQTVEKLIEAFDLVELQRPFETSVAHLPVKTIYGSPKNGRLIVVDKANGGKADAQNAGINLSRAPIFCVIDGDSILDPDALLRAAQPFIDDPEHVIAVGGTIRIANDSEIESGRIKRIHLPKRILPLFQVIEYLRAFLMARLAWSRINTLMIVSGAFGIFRRAEVVSVGGFTRGSVGEDLDLIVKLHRHMIERKAEYRIEFIPEPVCWTEAPETLQQLSRQRARWQRGALEVFCRHRKMLLNPRFGRIGLLGFGHMLIVDVVGPVMEVLGYFLVPAFWAFGVLSLGHLLAYTALVFTYGVFISVTSLILEETELKRFPRPRDLVILTAAAVIENFGYRQMTNFWRLRGYWQFLRSDTSWGEMKRAGFSSTRI